MNITDRSITVLSFIGLIGCILIIGIYVDWDETFGKQTVIQPLVEQVSQKSAVEATAPTNVPVVSAEVPVSDGSVIVRLSGEASSRMMPATKEQPKMIPEATLRALNQKSQ
jgi:hypothetical protein